MKIIKRILLAILLLFVILITLIYVNKDRVIKKIIANYNQTYNVTIAYKDSDLSLFKKFPNAHLAINNLSIVNDDLKDTLFVSNKIYLAMNIEDLFKKSNKIKIKEIVIDDATLNLIIKEEGSSTFNINKIHKTESRNTDTKNATHSTDFTIQVAQYELTNTSIIYKDEKSAILFELNGINHSGKGDFSSSILDLNTKTQANSMTVKVGNTTYFNKAKIDLDAVLGIDLNNLKFTFKKNSAKINDLNLVFNGFIDINDTNQLYNIDFNAPKANFKNILSLVPSAYSSNFSGVKATGIADVTGFFKGELSEKSFPKYTIHINTTNASFKYPDLPKSVNNINFNGLIASNTPNNDVFLKIKKLKFTIDKDTFETHGTITKLSTNPTVDASFKGKLNLENLSKAYPIKIEDKLKGVLTADFITKADQKSIKDTNFNKIKTNGTASLADFSYIGKDVANPIYIKNASIKFNTNSILLTDFNAKTGKSDIQAKGKLANLFAFLFDEKNLKGDFDVSSKNFVVSDFLVEDSKPTNDQSKNNTSNSQSSTKSLKIPDFLDIRTKFKAAHVQYDNIGMDNVQGLIQLKDQKATLTNTKAKMLKGNAIFNGDVDTKPTPAIFDLDMKIDKFDIANSFNTLETFKTIVPVAKALQGKYNTTFKIKGNLNDQFSPDLNSLTGNAFAQLFVNNISDNAIPLVSQLNSYLKFIDFSKIDLSKLKTALSFENGEVSVNPFEIKYQDITMHISGSHGFDKSLKYSLKMDVPAKYLGTEALNLLAKLTNIDKDTIKIPLTTMINGTLLKPNIKVNYKQALTNLSLKVIEYQKQELTNQATNQINDAVNDILANTGIDSILPTSNDSTSTNPTDVLNNGIKEGVNNVLNDLFGGKKKKKK